ncbi:MULTISPECIES: dephospho-CoA kinase [Coprobacillaceae]|uniref:dephospho-CoA kinase n=1 Tax=Coprobacillaceae TaxID=2810280 RepID=UPI001EEC0989|nr:MULTISPECIES: dephospho-CoA kinase [Coprobacillaceae]
MMKVIGITGSIACGKSTVTDYLLKLGYQVVDSDKISREALTKDLDCIFQVEQLFDCVENGKVDRKKLGRIIFHDEKAKKQLEGIIHPYVIKKLKQAIQSCQDSVIFLDIPLLYESHLEYLCDEIMVVYLSEEKQLERLMKRDHIDQDYARVIMNNQISIEEKKKRAQIIIDNNGTIDQLYDQLNQFVKGLRK